MMLTGEIEKGIPIRVQYHLIDVRGCKVVQNCRGIQSRPKSRKLYCEERDDDLPLGVIRMVRDSPHQMVPVLVLANPCGDFLAN